MGNFWEKYEGNFKEDKFEGTGKLYLTNGEVYEGEFKDGNIHGLGKYYRKNAELICGRWANNELVKILSKK